MLDTLQKYYEDGLLLRQTHPVYPLYIWNYSTKVQIDKLWDEVTLQCRGLITDFDGNIVARCIPKFFNLEEHHPDEIPKGEPYTITEKMDGSYLNIFYYDNKWLVSSRGSFTSEQAVRGTELLKNYNTEYGLIPEFSYVAELIVPENRIVVDYGDIEKIVIITTFNVQTGVEGSIQEMTSEGFDIVKTHTDLINESFILLKDNIDDNAEGYVVKFKNGFMIKIKGEEYVRLHYILTQISNRDIWKLAKDGGELSDLMTDVPDEFYDWAKTTYDDLLFKFNELKKQVEDEFWDLIDRKKYAEKVKSSKIKHLLFNRLTSHSERLNNMIWDMLYPEYDKPFSNTMKEKNNFNLK